MAEIADVLEVYHVFVSSPNDMETEREAVRVFFKSLNHAIAQPFGLQFDVVDWENCTNIGYQNTQDLITEQTLAKYRRSLALVIGLMGQRFGTPSGRFESGTQAEFEWAADHKRRHGHPEIKWFFRRIDRFVAPANNDEELRDALEQWKKVKRFRREYEGFYREFPDAASFPDVLREDLLRWFASWVAHRRSLRHGTARPPSRVVVTVPAFLDNPLSRTLRIVAALEDRLREENTECCIRICAVMSSLAITGTDAWAKPSDREYLQLIIRERDLIESLFKRRASLKVLLTWNIHEMIDWQKSSPQDLLDRLARLRSFCDEALKDNDMVQRLQVVHAGVRERNLLFLDNRYLFEGRKLGTHAGFEATEVIVEDRRIHQEIEMFDILFGNAVENEMKDRMGRAKNLNRRLIARLIQRINRDSETLKTSSRRRT